MVRQLLILATTLLLSATFAWTQTSGKTGSLSWDYNEETATLTLSGTGDMPNYELGTAPWGEFLEQIETITISSGITTIGNNAFSNCVLLTNINVPDGLRRIGESSFLACISLPSIILPPSLREIGDGAFESCEKLETVSLPASGLEIIEPFAFTECGALANLEIPKTVTTIGRWAFSGCIAIPKIIIPPSVRSIGDNAFSSNTALQELTLSEGLETIEEAAFSACESLPSVLIPASVKEIGGGVFSDCFKLKKIDINPQNKAYTTVDGVLYTANKQTIVQYPAGKEGGSFAIPTSVNKVGSLAFAGTVALTSVTLHDGLKIIEDYGFARCDELKTIAIPAGVAEIGNAPFHDCLSLATIEVSPENINYTSHDGVLYDKSQVTLIQYPAGKQDTSYSLPKSVQNIKEFGLFDNQFIESVELPSGLSYIGDLTFGFDKGLSEITVQMTDPSQVTLGLMVFFRGFGAVPCKLRVPKGTKELYQQSEQWQDFSEMEEFEPQGVELVTPIQPDTTVVYDLSGQQLPTDLQQLPDGIYIINGEKIIKQTNINL